MFLGVVLKLYEYCFNVDQVVNFYLYCAYFVQG